MKRRQLIWLFIVSLPILTGLRIYQLASTIDPSNGFYYPESSAVTYVATGLLVLFCAVFFVGGFLSFKRENRSPVIPQKNTMLGISSIVVAVGIAADFVRALCSDETVNPSHTVLLNILYIVSVVSAVCFLIHGACLVSGKRIPVGLTVFELVWAVYRLFVRYTTEFNGSAVVSENIYDVLVLCGIMMFLLYAAHIYCSSGVQKSVKWVFGFGLSGALLSVLVTIPRFAIRLFGNTEVLSHSSDPSFANLAIALYTVAFLAAVSSEKCKTAAFEDGSNDEEEYVPQFENAEESDADKNVSENSDAPENETVTDADIEEFIRKYSPKAESDANGDEGA